jgi:signal transduction histidine kinase
VSIDWRDFSRASKLSDVDLRIIGEPPGKPGTVLLIEGLTDPAHWRGRSQVAFHTELSKFISPMRPPDRFALNIRVDEEPIELATIDNLVQSAAQTRWSASFDGETLTIEGAVSTAFVRPQNQSRLREWEQIVASDSGHRLYDAISESNRAKGLGLTAPDVPGEIARFTTDMKLLDIDASSMPGGDFEDPGPFDATFEHFGLDRVTAAELNERLPSVFGQEASYRQVIRGLVGVHVYRDGFGIRTGEDWLQLGGAFTRASGFYSLRPSNTVGFVNISAAENRSLVETTDREGFVHNSAFLTFRALLTTIVGYAGECQNLIGRSFNDLVHGQKRQKAGVTTEEPLDSLSDRVSNALRDTASLRPTVESAREAIRGLPADALRAVEPALDEVERLVTRLDDVRSKAEVVEAEIADLNTRMAEMIEMVAIGLTAEALSHEITNAVNRLHSTADSLREMARRKTVDPSALAVAAENVQLSVRALRRQVSHLDPTLRYARDARRTFPIAERISENFEYHNDRWSEQPLRCELSVVNDFTVRISIGRFVQVLDNLVLNSEHWLRDWLAKKEIAEGVVTVVVDAPFVTFSDNGPGVEPTVENSLFEPFVTRKAEGLGRGLGLFVVRELLDVEGCSISLLPARNDRARRYQFEIDLTNALHD